MNVESLPVAVVALDRDLVISSVNGALCALIGVAPEDLVGRSVSVLRPRRLSGEDLLASDWHASAYLPGARRIPEQEVLLRRADGSEVETMIDGGYDRDLDGALVGATLLVRPLHRGPRRPRSGVRIVSAVSHELRSPLTSVRGYTSLLLKRWDEISDDDRKMMLQQVDRDARRISRMIGELLDISRLETGRLQLHRVEIDLEALASSVVEKVAMSYPDLQATVAFPQIFPKVWADPDKIEQVLTNLIENACKYASPSGIVVIGSYQGNDVVVEVCDTGPGIPAADLPRLFQQFFRSTQGRPTGTGLGLWISRGLIEAHGGELTARSVEADEQALAAMGLVDEQGSPPKEPVATGTTFRFTLPQRAFDDLHGRLAPENIERKPRA